MRWREASTCSLAASARRSPRRRAQTPRGSDRFPGRRPAPQTRTRRRDGAALVNIIVKAWPNCGRRIEHLLQPSDFDCDRQHVHGLGSGDLLGTSSMAKAEIPWLGVGLCTVLLLLAAAASAHQHASGASSARALRGRPRRAGSAVVPEHDFSVANRRGRIGPMVARCPVASSEMRRRARPLSTTTSCPGPDR